MTNYTYHTDLNVLGFHGTAHYGSLIVANASGVSMANVIAPVELYTKAYSTFVTTSFAD